MAYFLLSKKIAISQLEKLKQHFDLVAYSHKTNPEISKILQDVSDCLFSLHTISEVNEIKDSKRIIFFLQGQNLEEINELLNRNIKMFVVDNENDLKILLDALTKSQKTIEILFFRLKFKEHTFYTGKHFVYGFEWKKAIELISKLESSLVNKIGIHFHRKTQNVGEWQLKEELEEILSYDENATKKISLVNIGGGIPWRYHNSQPNIDLIFKKIDELREFLHGKNIKLMAEPGRFIASPSVRLVTKVKNVYDNTIVLDCSIYNSYMDTFLLNIRLRVLNEINENEQGFEYLIKGCSPDSLDIFRYKVKFKDEVKIGDFIVFLDAGAYNFHTEFQNLEKLKYVIVEDFSEDQIP
ncbi:MAG: decarboxylase [Candidatus Woesearchaeota archaeon]